MKQSSKLTAPYRHFAVLEEEFDADDAFEAAVIDSIKRCGTIDVHPNGWGIHDGFGVLSDGDPEGRPQFAWEREAKRRAAADVREANARASAAQLKAHFERRKRIQRMEHGRVRDRLARFLDNPNHWTRDALRTVLEPIVMRATRCDAIDARCAINEYMDWGMADADRNRLSVGEWLSKRIRGYG